MERLEGREGELIAGPVGIGGAERSFMQPKCTTCGSERVESAILASAAVTLDKSSTMKKVFNTGGQVTCSVCLDCGTVFHLRCDPAKLAQMLE